MYKKIELDAPCVGEIEKKYLCEAIDSGFISSVGPFISKFEQKVADYLGVKCAVAVQSGTAAIYMALYELGIKPGDEVIVPALTFPATVNPIFYMGAIPVIVDIDMNTWNIDPSQVRKAITNKTKAIIPVHLYGNPCDMQEIKVIAKEYNLYVIEDATESLGSQYNDRQTGSLCDLGCLSFNGNKMITTGGGGMVVSDDLNKIEHIRYLVNQAKDKDRPGFHSEVGFNYRMTNIEAAVGLAQLEKVGGFLDKKKIFKDIYQEILGDLPYLHFQEPYANAIGNGWLTCLTVEKEIKIFDLMNNLEKQGISSRRIFVPLNEMPYLKNYKQSSLNASEIYKKGICLPSSTLNEQEDIKEAALMIRKVLSE